MKTYPIHECESCGKMTKMKRFCCDKCRRKVLYTNPVPTLKPCINCGNETLNPKFCSKTCAAIYNNSKNPKRKKRVWHCQKCGQVKNKPSKYARQCEECNNRTYQYKYSTVGELRKIYTKKGWHRQNVFTYIREQARRILDTKNIKQCTVCGYNRHVEACHKKSISDYPDNAPISEINAIENLVALCPNCHWEFDHGLLKFE